MILRFVWVPGEGKAQEGLSSGKLDVVVHAFSPGAPE